VLLVCVVLVFGQFLTFSLAVVAWFFGKLVYRPKNTERESPETITILRLENCAQHSVVVVVIAVIAGKIFISHFLHLF